LRRANTTICGLDRSEKCENIRVLIDKLGAVVDDIVDDDIKVLLGVVLGNVLVGELLSGHFEIGGWSRKFFYIRSVVVSTSG